MVSVGNSCWLKGASESQIPLSQWGEALLHSLLRHLLQCRRAPPGILVPVDQHWRHEEHTLGESDDETITNLWPFLTFTGPNQISSHVDFTKTKSLLHLFGSKTQILFIIVFILLWGRDNHVLTVVLKFFIALCGIHVSYASPLFCWSYAAVTYRLLHPHRSRSPSAKQKQSHELTPFGILF